MVVIYEVRITTADGYAGYRVAAKTPREVLRSIANNADENLDGDNLLEVKVSRVQL